MSTEKRIPLLLEAVFSHVANDIRKVKNQKIVSNCG